MFGLRGIILQLLPQMTHVDPHVVAIRRVRGAPDFTQDLTMREYLAGICDQQGQQAIFDRRQVYRRPAFVNGAQAQINFDVAELEDRTWDRACVPPPPRGCAA